MKPVALAMFCQLAAATAMIEGAIPQDSCTSMCATVQTKSGSPFAGISGSSKVKAALVESNKRPRGHTLEQGALAGCWNEVEGFAEGMHSQFAALTESEAMRTEYRRVWMGLFANPADNPMSSYSPSSWVKDFDSVPNPTRKTLKTKSLKDFPKAKLLMGNFNSLIKELGIPFNKELNTLIRKAILSMLAGSATSSCHLKHLMTLAANFDFSNLQQSEESEAVYAAAGVCFIKRFCMD